MEAGMTIQPIEPMTIAIAADLHALAPELTDSGAYFTSVVAHADGKVTQYSEELTEAFLEQILADAPDALILPGDLTLNGERLSHAHLAEKLRRLRDAGISVLVIPGNHDLENPTAAAFRGAGFAPVESVTAADFAEIYASCGFADALARDDASLSYVAALSPGLRVLMLDVNTAEAPGAVTDATLAWAERQLEDAARGGAGVLAVSHQNLLQHNSAFAGGFVIANRERLLALYARYHVRCNFSGHMHIQHIAESAAGVREIVTSALSVAPNQYGVLRVTDAGAAYHTVPTDVAAWARGQGRTEPELLNFSAFSREFFLRNTLRQARVTAGDAPEADAMADYLAAMNLAYFSGRMDTVARDEALLQAWRDTASYASVYVPSLAVDISRDSTRDQFQFEEGTT